MLRYLDLSFNSFVGNIPQSIGDLISVELLNLSRSYLSGGIPSSLANLLYLKNKNLSFNNLEGEILSSGAFSNLRVSSLVGNLALCRASRLGFPPCLTNSTVSNPSTRKRLLRYIQPATAFAVVSVFCICILLRFYWNRTRSTQSFISIHSPNNYIQIDLIHELVRATENFSEANLLERGSFGSVYRGCLDDGQLTAIKVLNLGVDKASESFDAECHTLCMARHRNLVRILSTCSNLDSRLYSTCSPIHA